MLIAQRRISPALQKGETEVAQSVPGREYEPALSCCLCMHQPFGGMMKGEGKLGNPSRGGGGGRENSNPEWGRLFVNPKWGRGAGMVYLLTPSGAVRPEWSIC